jgi:hypothetical protein
MTFRHSSDRVRRTCASCFFCSVAATTDQLPHLGGLPPCWLKPSVTDCSPPFTTGTPPTQTKNIDRPKANEKALKPKIHYGSSFPGRPRCGHDGACVQGFWSAAMSLVRIVRPRPARPTKPRSELRAFVVVLGQLSGGGAGARLRKLQRRSRRERAAFGLGGLGELGAQSTALCICAVFVGPLGLVGLVGRDRCRLRSGFQARRRQSSRRAWISFLILPPGLEHV